VLFTGILEKIVGARSIPGKYGGRRSLPIPLHPVMWQGMQGEQLPPLHFRQSKNFIFIGNFVNKTTKFGTGI